MLVRKFDKAFAHWVKTVRRKAGSTWHLDELFIALHGEPYLMWRAVNSRANVMPGFKRFRNAAVTISGIELMHRIRKGQFNLTNLRLKETTAPAVWTAVLSAC